ncbi:translation initiation factor IF-2 [Eubacterium ruminantium]|uniref:translation initiation factor IF-2 n=2 Tax=Eubacterium ruminantium TaxID=42322 RepID=UPI001567E300|nr:translation initiation factor IF-2 [Eubacterium ruminantium]
MRVYEFAKQLTGETGKAISSNDVLQLVGNKKEGLKASSGIDDELMAYVRNILNAKNTQAKPAAADNANEKSVKSEEKTPVKTDNNDSQNGNVAARQSGDRPVRRDGDRPVRDGDRPRRDGDRPVRDGDRPRRDGDRPVRDGDRPRRDGDRPVRDGDRPRRDGDRPVRDGDRPRRDGDRPIRRDGDRPRRDGDRPIRRDGDRPVRDGDRPRRDGDRPVRDGDRPRRDGDRPIRRDGDRFSGGMRDNRDRNRDRMGRDRDHDKDMFDKDSDRDVRDRGRDNRRERDNRDVDRDQHSRRESEKRDRESRRDREKHDKEKRDRESMRPEITRKSQSHKDSHKDVKKEPVKQEPAEPVIKNVILPEVLTVKELADKLKQPVNAMIKKLFLEGKIVTVNTELSFESAAEIALEYNYIADEEEKVDIIEELLKDEEDPEDSLSPRPPVVCVMGHVDHGKTSLLDAIRKTQVTADEAGGITQHIGAYVVKANDQRITFLDTPGHEAFTAMRMRGAQSTDIAILVVAADDGVMPQTVEAINHAKAAGIEIIVAVNKIDKESANVERVKQELTEYGLIAEDWGGSTIFCPVSAHTREGLDNLLDMILLTADMLELKANKNRLARGLVIEARLDKGRGPVATLLVQKGTLKVGDHIAIGEVSGRVRAMLDHKQRRLKEATPSTPVEIIGLNGVPNSGDIFLATKGEKEAREITDAFKTRGKENLILDTKRGMSLDDLFNKMQEGTVKELDLIIKADVQGSVEAVKQSLLKLSNEEIVIKCIHSGVGAINESDVTLAAASNAIIIGFNIRPDAQAKSLADQEKVDVRLYRVIYNAIDDIESAMKGMLDPIFEEKIIGHVEVRQTYKASGIGTIAGSYVLDGLVQRGCSARITRDGEQIFDGKLASLKRFKDDVKEVKAGYECGLVFEDFNDIKVDDQIECYAMVEVPR